MLGKNKTLFVIIKNKGGLADVARAYLEYFRLNKNSDEFLLILSEKNDSHLGFTNSNIFSILLKELPLLPDDMIVKKYQKKIDKLLHDLNITSVVCDYLSFPFFKHKKIKIVADIHYLMAASNRIQVPRKSLKKQSLLKSNLQVDDIFRISLLKREMIERQLIEKASTILVNSKTTLRDLKKYYPDLYQQKKIQVVPVYLTIDLSQWSAIEWSKKSRKGSKFIYHGRLNSLKGFDFLIHLSQKPTNRLILIGSSGGLQKEWKKQKNIKMKNWIWDSDELKMELRQSWFHLFPSLYEPWGLSLTKSLNMGAICIAQKSAGGHVEQIKDGQNGFLIDFNQKNAADLVEKIVRMSDKSLMQISKSAKLTFKKKTTHSSHYIKMIKKAIG